MDSDTGNRNQWLTIGLRTVESPVPGDRYAGFGRGPAGNDWWKHQHRARWPTSPLTAPGHGRRLSGLPGHHSVALHRQHCLGGGFKTLVSPRHQRNTSWRTANRYRFRSTGRPRGSRVAARAAVHCEPPTTRRRGSQPPPREPSGRESVVSVQALSGRLDSRDIRRPCAGYRRVFGSELAVAASALLLATTRQGWRTIGLYVC